MSFLEKIQEKAKGDIKTIVLPEGNEPRIVKAARYIQENKIAKVILLISNQKKSEMNNNLDLTGLDIIEYEKSELFEEYAKQLSEIRKHKGLTLEKARQLLKHPNYFGVMMVYNGVADGMVSGAIHSTADTLRPALQIIKTAPNTKLVSSFFIMSLQDKSFGNDGIMIFSDCGLNEKPNQEQLCDIAISSAKTYKDFVDKQPKVAMLSYSTYGSAESETTKKVSNATKLVKEKSKDLIVDGEIQLDAAVIPEINKRKAPGSPLKGNANVLIFPDLNSGNIGYKLVQRFAKADAYGPMTQGLNKPINDLSRGSTVEDIIGVISLTAVQAQMNK